MIEKKSLHSTHFRKSRTQTQFSKKGFETSHASLSSPNGLFQIWKRKQPCSNSSKDLLNTTYLVLIHFQQNKHRKTLWSNYGSYKRDMTVLKFEFQIEKKKEPSNETVHD